VTRIRAILAVLILALALTATTPSAGAAARPAYRNGHGITVVQAKHTSARVWRLTVTTHALARAVRVNVLLPRGYAGTKRRYPVLYLFHGTSGGADDWLSQGNAAAATAAYPMIVVMPDAGYDSNGGSWFTNWVDQKTALGTANWETFHIDQLIPWIDANLRTIASRQGRAIAGLSQGGFGSTSYAARHPDLFVSAGSFSGAPDIASNPVAEAAATAIISATATGLDGVEPDAFFGSHADHEINWQGHNPATLVTNLRPVDLELWTGNGVPGPYDSPSAPNPSGSAIEATVHQSAQFFAQAASKAKVAYHLDDYGPGTHTWPYWTRDLAQYLPRLARVFRHPPATPPSISYRSIDKSWTQWGWTVANRRSAAQDWSSLTGATKHHFALATADSARVTTPPDYRPGSHHRIAVTGGSGPRSATAGSGGRLHLTITVASATATVAIR
jgi:S-formylglutathione hydrolase FrmB